MAEEGEVLSLEAQSLSARVSATLQRGLNTATDDLAAAQKKSKNAGDYVGGDDAGLPLEAGLDEVNQGKTGAAGVEHDEYADSVYGLSPDGSSVAGGG